MKRNMIIATAMAVAGVAAYYIRRRLTSSSGTNTTQQTPRSNHLTNAFSKAKQHALSV